MSAVRDRHYEQARYNRDVAEQLLRDHADSPCHVQWAVTVAFYCAVHTMQGYLVDRGHDPKTHVTREALIADPVNHVPNDVYRAYVGLKQFSEKARYRLGTFDPAWVKSAVLDGRLKKVTEFVGL